MRNGLRSGSVHHISIAGRRLYGAALVVLLLAFSAKTGAVDFYTYQGRPVVLERENSLVGVDFGPGVGAAAAGTFAAAEGQAALDGVVARLPRAGRYVCTIKGAADGLAGDRALASLAADPRVQRTYPVFRNPKTGLLVYVFDEIIVRLRPGADREELARLNAQQGVEIVEQNRYDPSIYLLRLAAPGKSCLDVANAYGQSGLCLWAEPNFFGQVFKYNVNDPYYPNQWHLNNTGQTGGTADADVDAPDAWAITAGSPAIVIATLDDGIDMVHEDLAANIFINPGESGGGRETNGVDDDGNGFIDDVRGWDFCDNDNNSDHDFRNGSLEGHGTAVAGIAAGVGNNGIGTAGAAYNCRILPVKIFKGDEFAGDYEVGNAIRYASTIADVLSNSWGGGAPSADLDSAIAFAVEHGRAGRGCPTIFASGNAGSPEVSNPSRNMWAVSVGASDPDDVRFDYSNYGPRLTVISPSGDWTADITGLGAGYDDGDPSGNYTGVFGGTSSATPLVAGIAGLLLSLNPNLTALDVQTILQATADKINPGLAQYNSYGFSLEYGYGRVNAHSALLAVQGGQLPDDPFEENDTRDAAAVVEKGFYSALAGLDDDWFGISVNPTEDLMVEIHFIHQNGDLQLEIYNPQGAVVAASNGTSNTETVVANAGVTGGGLWTIRVFGQGGATNHYHMSVNKRPPDDAFEQNDELGEAKRIAPGIYRNLRCYDPDYYVLRVESGQLIIGVIRFPAAEGDLDLYLLDSTGNLLDYSESYTNSVEAAWYENTGPADDFYLFVNNWLEAENVYEMEIIVVPAGDDGFEENDARSIATPITAGAYDGLRCFDDDWYAIDLGPGHILDANAFFIHALGDVDIELYDATGAELDYSAGVSDSERIVWVNTSGTATTVYLHVFPYVEPNPQYRLLINVIGLNDDRYEDNDDAAHATPIGQRTLGDLVALDDDYFALSARQGQTIAAMFNSEPALAPLELTLYSPAGAPLITAPVAGFPVLVFRQAPTTGTYHLKMGFADTGPINLYGLSAFVYDARPGTEPDDPYEPNDTRTEAAWMGPGAYPGLYCRNNDYFAVHLLEGDALYVGFTFSNPSADLDLALYDPLGIRLARSTGTTDVEFVGLERAARTGLHYVHVYPYAGRAAYDLYLGRWQRTVLLSARRWMLY